MTFNSSAGRKRMKLRWKITVGLAAVIAIFSFVLLSPDDSLHKAVEETRRALRQQGFQTDLADFDFSTSSELRAHEAAITSAPSRPPTNQSGNLPDLMRFVTSNSAVVVWIQDWLPADFEELHWQDLHGLLDPDQPELEAACHAALSGPIGFNLEASRGSAMLLKHLAPLKYLSQILGDRMVLALHEGQTDAAWTNLLASTRLVTAWEPEASELSHLALQRHLPLAPAEERLYITSRN